MKILVIQETDWIQSLPLQSHQIMEYLSRKGHQVTVIDFEARWEPPPMRSQHFRTRVFSKIRRTGSGSHVLLVRPGMVKLPGIARLTAIPTQFKTIFERMARQCDVVVLYSVPTNGLQAILSAKLLKKPVLFHSFDILHRMTGYGFLAAPTWTLERFVYKRVDRFIVISAALRKYIESMGVSERDIVLLPPAVDTDSFNPSVSGFKFRSQLGLKNEDKVALFSGWLYEFSGLDILMRTINTILQRVPDFKLVVCGDGPLLKTLRSIAIQLEIEEHVRILGRLPYEQMPMAVASADLCINPYLPEGRSNFAFPSKIAEYMAAGKAVLATDLPGTRSFLPEGSGVRLVSPSRFIEALQEMLVDDTMRDEAARAARLFCEQNFSLDSIACRFETELTNLAALSC